MGEEDDFNLKEIGNLALKKGGDKTSYEDNLNKAQQSQQAAQQSQQAAQQTKQGEREAQKASTKENIDKTSTLVSFKGQNFNYSEALKNYGDFKKTFSEFVKSNKISQKDAEILTKIIEESSKLLEKQKKGTLSEKERDKLLLLESQFNKEMRKTFEENKNKFNKKEIDWFNDQIKKSDKRIKDLTADVMNLGARTDFVDFHAQRLMQAMVNQVNIANQQRELTLEQIMVEYMDKMAFIRESVKQVAEAKETKDEKKVNVAIKYVETYDHETTDLTETMRAAQVFVLATRSENHKEKIEIYRENTTLEFSDGIKEKPLTDYLRNTVPFHI